MPEVRTEIWMRMGDAYPKDLKELRSCMKDYSTRRRALGVGTARTKEKGDGHEVVLTEGDERRDGYPRNWVTSTSTPPLPPSRSTREWGKRERERQTDRVEGMDERVRSGYKVFLGNDDSFEDMECRRCVYWGHRTMRCWCEGRTVLRQDAHDSL